MRRTLFLSLSFAFALVFGVIIGQMVEVMTVPASSAVVNSTTLLVVRSFYDAANAVIRTGDLSALDPVVASSYVDHAAAPGVSADRAGLGRSLMAIHAVAPFARFEIAEVAVAGDRAMVRVALAGVEDGVFGGLAVRGGAILWGGIDIVRVADRRVVERWGEAEDTVSLVPLGRIGTGPNPTVDAGMTLERVMFGPGQHVAGSAGESRVLMVESGRLTVAVDAASPARALIVEADAAGSDAPTEVVPGTRTTLTAGDVIVLPSNARYLLSADDAAPVTSLVAAIYPTDDSRREQGWADSSQPPTSPLVMAAKNGSSGPWPADLAVQTLVGVTDSPVPSGTGAIGVGRVVIEPGAWLPSLAPPGPLVLIVESGTLDHATGDATARVNGRAADASQDVADGVFVAGVVTLVRGGETLSLHNPGTLPATVLVVAVVPDLEPVPTSRAPPTN